MAGCKEVDAAPNELPGRRCFGQFEGLIGTVGIALPTYGPWVICSSHRRSYHSLFTYHESRVSTLGDGTPDGRRSHSQPNEHEVKRKVGLAGWKSGQLTIRGNERWRSCGGLHHH